MNPALANSVRTALILLAFTLLGTAMLAYTFQLTRDIIAASEEREKLALISQVLPPTLFDNDILTDTIKLPPTEALGTIEPSLVYRATLHGQPAALVFEAVAPDGYAGRIYLLVAVKANGELAGVRVVSHNETPGLGDYIDIAKSPWIRVFEGKSLANVRPNGWKVKKDGGDFPYVSGATITPRAVIKAVHGVLMYFEKEGGPLFARPAAWQEQHK
ncbi:electron transport complex subunit RsxG [Thiobacter aerophilum]|uniref:Ion-translocating oxidoreductase complex subunit G n=1 Tax=Thiobacter aerophilum TaxID=3121275 RepID=A0ABV0EBZ0_9BURK